jgi:hypothetical protein
LSFELVVIEMDTAREGRGEVYEGIVQRVFGQLIPLAAEYTL